MLIKFPADLGDKNPVIVFHQVVCGFTIETAIACDVNFAGEYVVMGGVYRGGYLVLGSAALNYFVNVHIELATSEPLTRMPYNAAFNLATDMFISLGAKVILDHKDMIVDAIAARSAQENPNVLANAHLN